jgi:hypothetical protein
LLVVGGKASEDKKKAAEDATDNGDLVKHAGDTRSLNEWKCWMDDGKFYMEAPKQIASNSTQPKVLKAYMGADTEAVG